MDHDQNHHILHPLIRTSTVNTIATTATGSSTSSNTTIKARQHQSSNDFYFPRSYAYGTSSIIAPTPPARSSSLLAVDHAPHPPPFQVQQPPKANGKARGKEVYTEDSATGDSDDEDRQRILEEKKLIAREKGKLRQRRKRARDKAAKEVCQSSRKGRFGQS